MGRFPAKKSFSLPIPPYCISRKLSCLKTSKNVLSVLGLIYYYVLYCIFVIDCYYFLFLYFLCGIFWNLFNYYYILYVLYILNRFLYIYTIVKYICMLKFC